MEPCRSGKEQKNHAKEPRINYSRVLALPDVIINDIFSRCTLETIFNCRSVCKTFDKILKDPYFVQVHITKTSNGARCLIIQNLNKACDNFLFVDMNDPEKLSSPWKFEYPLAAISQGFQPSRVTTSLLVGSCNGLVCLIYTRLGSQTICVCNPVLGEFILLPSPSDEGLSPKFCFGFCPKTKKYKVVQLTSSLFTEIHTIGTNIWRKIEYVPRPSKFKSILDCSFLDGSLPFLTESSDVSRRICSFNFETERYIYIPPPTHFFIEETRNRITCVEVGLLGGLFCISRLLDKTCFEVWVMKTYGVKESWTKELTINFMLNCMPIQSPNNLFSSINNDQIELITLLNNGDMVIRSDSFRLLYYSHQKGIIVDILNLSGQEYKNDRLRGYYSALDLVPSFISLKDIGLGSAGVLQRSKLHSL